MGNSSFYCGRPQRKEIFRVGSTASSIRGAIYLFDIVLRNGVVVDPTNDVEGPLDVAIKDKRIGAVEERISEPAREVMDVRGKVIVPGIIDSHVHVSTTFGSACGYKMMAKVGVTTAVDLAGPIEDILTAVGKRGAGLNVACLNYLSPGHLLTDESPTSGEIREAIRGSMEAGALGVKILGGHYPFTPDATAKIIEVANEEGTYVAFHAGTTEHGSDIEGLAEAVGLASGNPLHVAHINSYCRGQIMDLIDEVGEALKLLRGKEHIVSESYLADINGTDGKCTAQVPDSNVTKTCLQMKGYPPTRDGLARAISDGKVLVNVESGGEVILRSGREGREYWEARDTEATVSFSVNPPISTLSLALARDANGGFIVPAISTDGGGIPRNVTVERGLALVQLGAMSLRDFAIKTSVNPAKMFGLSGKGTLSVGADADVTVLDVGRRKAVMGVSGGDVIMVDGIAVGKGGIILTTSRGSDAVNKSGNRSKIVDLSERFK